MNKILISITLVVPIAVFFSLTVFVLPEQYMSNEKLISQPYFEAELSSSEISLGDSFRINIASENRGDYGDIHIVSAAFPNLETMDDVVHIATYDFTQSAVYILPGEEIGSVYSGGLEYVEAKYPSIEAMNRPIHPDSKNHLELIITPQKPGLFPVYVKSVNIPHVNDLSHFPSTGKLDHQNEHVLVYTVNVNP